MLYQWQFQPYRRRFKQALQTSHGLWTLREGIIVQLVNEAGNVGWGEIAPIPWFGSETLEQAWAFCHQLPSTLTDELIFSIPDALPCCQFAFESAWEGVRGEAIEKTAPQRRRDAESQAAFVPENSIVAAQNSDIAAQNLNVRALHSTRRPQNSIVAAQNSDIAAQNSELPPKHSTLEVHPTPRTPHPAPHTPNLPHSALLPAGETALHAWKPLWEQGFRTFKWKIGVQAIATELELLHELTQTLPPPAKLRLDANGGLSLNEAIQWLQVCDAIIDNPNHSAAIEYIEQPLGTSQFQTMQDLSRRYQTPIALDESVATLRQLQTCYANGWRGVFVIKPAIVGSPMRLRQFCQEHPIDAVFSSAFETAIGRQAGLRLAATLGNPDRAMGYGTTHWVDEAETTDLEQQWQTF